MRKYICDNCNAEFEILETADHYNLFALHWVTPKNSMFSESKIKQVGEYCQDCKEKIEKRIKEGVN